MIKHLILKTALPFRRIFGIELLLQNQKNHIDRLENLLQSQALKYQRSSNEQRQMLEQALSILMHTVVDCEKVKQSAKYQRCAEIITLLSPLDVIDSKYTRFGRNFDGGYIMLDEISPAKVSAAYSLGLSNDVSWDESVASREIKVYMYDHTIENLPKNHPNFNFFRTGVCGNHGGPNLKTLGEIISENGHSEFGSLILKMDIEGCEWDVFDQVEEEVIRQFSQIVVEFHGLDPSVGDARFSKMLSVLEKINLTHQSIHVHANICEPATWIGDLVLPRLIEVTYVRRADFADRLVPNQRRFPTPLDQPTFDGFPDLDLGEFKVTH